MLHRLNCVTSSMPNPQISGKQHGYSHHCQSATQPRYVYCFVEYRVWSCPPPNVLLLLLTSYSEFYHLRANLTHGMLEHLGTDVERGSQRLSSSPSRMLLGTLIQSEQ